MTDRLGLGCDRFLASVDARSCNQMYLDHAHCCAERNDMKPIVPHSIQPLSESSGGALCAEYADCK